MPPPAGPAPLARRVAQTLFAPRALFEDLRVHAPWAGPLLISVAVAMLAAAALPASHFTDAMRAPVDRLGRPVTVTSAPATIALWGRILLAFSAAVMQPLIAFVLAGALALGFGGLLRGEGRFAPYLALVSHVLLIPALGTLLAVAVQLARGAPWEPSLAVAVPGLAGDGFAARLLAALNPFTLWALAAAALGVSVLEPKRSATGVALPLFGLLLLLAAATAAIP